MKAAVFLALLLPFASQAAYHSSVTCKIANRDLSIVEAGDAADDFGGLRSGRGSGSIVFKVEADELGMSIHERLDQIEAIQNHEVIRSISLKSAKNLAMELKLVSGNIVSEKHEDENCSFADSRISNYVYSVIVKAADGRAMFQKNVQVQCDFEGFNPVADISCVENNSDN